MARMRALSRRGLQEGPEAAWLVWGVLGSSSPCQLKAAAGLASGGSCLASCYAVAWFVYRRRAMPYGSLWAAASSLRLRRLEPKAASLGTAAASRRLADVGNSGAI